MSHSSLHWLVPGALVCGILGCERVPTDPPLPVEPSGGAGGASGGAASGGVPSSGGMAGYGGSCEADPADRCSVPVEMCTADGVLCEAVCVHYFYCADNAVFWDRCLGVYLYDCPDGCEERFSPDGLRAYYRTEADVCNPPAAGGSPGLGGSDG